MLGLLRHLSGGAARSYSPIPLIGGVPGAAALAAAPVEAVSRWFWPPLVRDPGTGLYLLALVCLCLSVDRFVRATFQQRKSKFLQMA